jgi:uncharacterized protein (TIGR02466 family)
MNAPIYRNLFPIPIFFDTLGRNFTEKEIFFIKNLKLINNIFNSRSESSYILNYDSLIDIKNFVETSVKKYFNDVYKPKTDLEIYLTQSWLNVSQTGETHHIHNHPNSFISGTLYISADREIDSITFAKTDHTSIRPVPNELNEYNSTSWFFNVGVGDLILFPSNLNHYVDAVRESSVRNERISLSFNTFLRGTIGSEIFLNELKL